MNSATGSLCDHNTYCLKMKSKPIFFYEETKMETITKTNNKGINSATSANNCDKTSYRKKSKSSKPIFFNVHTRMKTNANDKGMKAMSRKSSNYFLCDHNDYCLRTMPPSKPIFFFEEKNADLNPNTNDTVNAATTKIRKPICVCDDLSCVMSKSTDNETSLQQPSSYSQVNPEPTKIKRLIYVFPNMASVPPQSTDETSLQQSSSPVNPDTVKTNQPVCVSSDIMLVPPKPTGNQTSHQLSSPKSRNRKKTIKKKSRLATKLETLTKLTAGLSETCKLFLSMQIKLSRKKTKGRRFTEEEKTMALSIFKTSPKCYGLLEKMFILPSRRILEKLAENMVKEGKIIEEYTEAVMNIENNEVEMNHEYNEIEIYDEYNEVEINDENDQTEINERIIFEF